MTRVNVTSWQDCVIITRYSNNLTDVMMKYQMYTWPPETQGNGSMSGDREVMIAAIELRNRLNTLIEKSRAKNAS